MKYISAVGLAGALIGLVGCASAHKVAVVEPVGPGPVVSHGTGDGSLVIYSAHVPADATMNEAEWRWNNDFGKNAFLTEPAHSDYVVYSENGNVVQHVRNARTENDDTPTVVKLPAGSYRVEADAIGCDGLRVKVEFTTVIRPGQTTMANLGGHWTPSAPYKDTEVARLPCGKIIGWRAPVAGFASAPSGS